MSKKNRNQLAHKMAAKWKKNTDKEFDREQRITRNEEIYPCGAKDAARKQSEEQAKNADNAIKGVKKQQ